MERFSKQLRDGVKAFGYSVYISIEQDDTMCFLITDGDHDRTYRVNAEDTNKLLNAVGGLDNLVAKFPTNNEKTDEYIKIFETLCKEHSIEYTYSSWLSGFR
ncbi:MAG: hypothetical protein FWD32_02265 [Firmicutes bacterium]|nr:hypothetical protein [Bacillota bacterium]